MQSSGLAMLQQRVGPKCVRHAELRRDQRARVPARSQVAASASFGRAGAPLRMGGLADARSRRRHPMALHAADEAADHEGEGGKFVPIEEGLAGEDGRFGPDAVLLAGFPLGEVKVVRAMLDDMGAEFVSVVVVSADMLRRGLTLGQALSERQDQRTGRDWAPAAGEGVPRLMLLSGMSHDELMSVIQDFQELGLERAMFAAAVPKSINTPLETLLAEIAGDDAEMRAREAAPAAASGGGNAQ